MRGRVRTACTRGSSCRAQLPVTIVMMLGLCGIARGQTPTPSQPEAGALAEIVVTAQKRAEPLQAVPEAVSAVTGSTLEAMGADSFTAYARTIPGLTFTDLGAGRQKTSLRGLNSTIGADTDPYSNVTLAIPGRPRYVVNRPRTVQLNVMYQF